AHERMDADRARYSGRFRGGRPPGVRGKHLLTGMGNCGGCGGGVEAQTRLHGSDRVAVYVCAASCQRGLGGWRNRLWVRVDAVDTAVLDLIETNVLAPDVFEDAIRLAVGRLTERPSTLATLDREIRKIRQEIDRLVSLAAASADYPSPAIATEIRRRERQ